MKHIRKLICAALVAALLLVTAAPAFAAVSVYTDGNTLYMTSTSGETPPFASIQIDGLKSTSKITGVKSSNKSVASVYSTAMSSYIQTIHESNKTYKEYFSTIFVEPLKVGSATISFNVDGKSYNQKFTIAKYANPVKTFKLTGISGENLKSKFAKSAFASGKLKTASKAGYFQVDAASGWKIQRIEWNNYNGEDSRCYLTPYGTSSAKIKVPAMKKGDDYSASATFFNTKTKGTITVCYNLYG